MTFNIDARYTIQTIERIETLLNTPLVKESRFVDSVRDVFNRKRAISLAQFKVLVDIVFNEHVPPSMTTPHAHYETKDGPDWDTENEVVHGVFKCKSANRETLVTFDGYCIHTGKRIIDPTYFRPKAKRPWGEPPLTPFDISFRCRPVITPERLKLKKYYRTKDVTRFVCLYVYDCADNRAMATTMFFAENVKSGAKGIYFPDGRAYFPDGRAYYGQESECDIDLSTESESAP